MSLAWDCCFFAAAICTFCTSVAFSSAGSLEALRCFSQCPSCCKTVRAIPPALSTSPSGLPHPSGFLVLSAFANWSFVSSCFLWLPRFWKRPKAQRTSFNDQAPAVKMAMLQRLKGCLCLCPRGEVNEGKTCHYH